MTNNTKLILSNPHMHVISGTLEWCIDYRLLEAVEGISDGMVACVPDYWLGNADILEQLKSVVVADINSRQNTCVFLLDDIITWECSL